MNTHSTLAGAAAMLILLCFAATASDRLADPVQHIETTLAALHGAASKADGKRYFELFAPDAVFLGTDATERWTIDEFRAYAMKRFETGTGWTYTLRPDTRHIVTEGDVAWFDELLDNAKYGTCRGSGVLRKIGETWKIAQYNLAFAIPNERAEEVVEAIHHGAAQPTTIYLVRHAEKNTSDPGNADPDLSEAGRERAEALRRLLADVKFDQVIVSHMKRTMQTVESLLPAGAKPMVLDGQDAQSLPQELRNELRGKTVLVCGHSNTLPQIMKSIGVNEPIAIDENTFDVLYIVTLSGSQVSVQRLHYGE